MDRKCVGMANPCYCECTFLPPHYTVKYNDIFAYYCLTSKMEGSFILGEMEV